MTAIIILGVTYVFVCCLAYLPQEKIIFFPERLSENHKFNFSNACEEVYVPTHDGLRLHGLLFKAVWDGNDTRMGSNAIEATTDSIATANGGKSKGLIFYLHGNAGSLNSWGEVSSVYLRFGYDVFLMDYRGYGKSEGKIESERQLILDVQTVYDYLLRFYDQREVVVLGYSLGSGLAARLAAANAPRLLILQAPYYSLTDMMRHTMPFLPTFLLKYKLRTNEVYPACMMPVVMFHGTDDEVIPYSQSLKLQALFKAGDSLISLPGVGHNGMTTERDYVNAISAVLATSD